MATERFGGRTTCDEVIRGVDLTGRAALVTGCNTGIGLETARALASAGAQVILACRTADSAESTAARIRAARPAASLVPLVVDLASFASVRRAVERIPAARLHILVCNAGLYTPRYQTTEEGVERTVGVCHFGHFLLSSLLMDKIRAAAPARVVVVASESHRYPATLSFDRFPLSRDRYRGLVAYGQAKLCNVLFANEITRRFRNDGISANSLHPGTLIGTSIFRSSLAAKMLGLAARPFTKSLAQGAATTVYCAVAPELEGTGGRYFADCREKAMSRGARDETAARRLWEVSESFIRQH